MSAPPECTPIAQRVGVPPSGGMNFDSETMPKWFGLPKKEDLPTTFSIEYVRSWKCKDAESDK